MPLKEQLDRINWMQFLINALSITSMVLTGLLVAAKVWGDTLWIDADQATEIAAAVADRAVRVHETATQFHPSQQATNDRLDDRYILRREMTLILNRIDMVGQSVVRIEQKLSSQ